MHDNYDECNALKQFAMPLNELFALGHYNELYVALIGTKISPRS